MADQVPIVDYLVLGESPHLVANECTSCGARYFDRRNACASCGSDEFLKVPIETTGTLKAFTIVEMAAPGVAVPFVAGLFECGGTAVRANIVNVEPDPVHLSFGMPLRLTTSVLGTDDLGAEAVTFGFEPASSA